MRTKICIIVFLTITAGNISAQERSEKNLFFKSIFQEGIVTGETETALQLQFINGAYYKKFFAGAGIGLDYYYERSFPVFIDLRTKIFNRPPALFFYADGGYNFLWQKTKDNNQVDRDGGLFYELGIGYEIHVYKKLKLLVGGGYSYKGLSKTFNRTPWLNEWPLPKTSLYKYDYSLGRISLKAGFSF